MTDLETKLAEARERLAKTFVNSQRATRTCFEGFDAAADIAREVVAERDAQFEFEAAGFVRRLAEKDKQLLDMSAYTAEFNVYREQLVQMTKELAEKDAEIARLKADIDGLIDGSCPPRKVTDAQLDQIKMAIKIITSCQLHQAAIATNAVRQIIEESTDEPAAK